MNNKLFALAGIMLVLTFVSIGFASAESNSCSPTIKLVSQDPNPAVPNDYVKVIFEITNFGYCDGLSVRLNPEYPFSLDSNDSAIQTIETNPYARGYRSVWMIPYKIRVDSAAFDGDYDLKLQYHDKSSTDFNSYIEEGFNVTIKDSRTSFDTVIQEVSGSDVSIAVANIGKFAANSVVVRIPEQDLFMAVGTDGQMVGNLESGDYTIVGFSISPKGTFSRNFTKTNSSENFQQSSSNKLKFDIYYTDNIGERRIVNEELSLNMGNSSMMGAGGFNARRTTSTSSLSGWYKWIVILGILIVLFILYKKYPKQSKDFLNKVKLDIKNISKKEEKEIIEDIHKIPNWIKNVKEKEKKK